MTQLKELYMGKSIDDLKKHIDIDVSKAKLAHLLKSANKIYQEAEKYQREGDEEMAYIYTMRYFNIIDQIRRSPDYSREKRYVLEMLGGNSKQMAKMDQCEALQKSLEKRYKQLVNLNKNEHNWENNIKKDDNKTKIDNDNEKVSNANISKSSLMNTCEELYNMTQDPLASLLIMDCRPENDYKASKLQYPHCLNVPEEIILPGMSAGKVQNQLKPNSKALWASRSIKDNVVLMDWNSQGPEPVLHSPLWRLKDILQHWDPDVSYRSPIKILQGGYENYILQYPTQCTNPNVKAPSNKQNDTESLDAIEYPSITDINMKDQIQSYGTLPELNRSLKSSSSSSHSNVPLIDRSSKAAALKTYDQNQQNLMELLRKKESILDKTLDTQKKIREAESQMETISSEISENFIQDDEKNGLLTNHKDLYYTVLQLQSKKDDYILEIQKLKEELEEYKRNRREAGDADVIEIQTLEETEKRIENKEDLINDEDDKENIDMQEKQKQLIVRNEKRHLMPPSDEDEISKPKIPQFDRSSKPIFKNIVPDYEIQRYERDFSPVPGTPMGPGLTGLKNLGNTCYMNSIIQCLSNTNYLVEYFKTNSYKKHINRSNKTRGKIVEEVAELIKVLWSGKFKCVASKDLRYVIGQCQQIFRGVEQQDSHEFLTILMDWLHSDLQTIDVNESPKDNLPASEKAWLEFTKSRESYILQLFYGQIKSTVKCIECKKESATYECFSNLSLELPPTQNRCELFDCLNMYFFGEKVSGWHCPNCKQNRDAIKKLDISKLPPILVIHLKRFYADSDILGTTIYRKKQTYVDFPLTNLNMTSHIAPSEQSKLSSRRSYHLYAVSNHYGSMESGHYTAFCKSRVTGRWFKYDDQVVAPVDSSDVVSSAAYILFYTNLPDTTDDGM